MEFLVAPFLLVGATLFNAGFFELSKGNEYSELCRKFASSKYEPDNAGYGVEFKKIDVKLALEACVRASRHSLSASPDFYRLARVLWFNKDSQTAAVWFQKSADSGYAPGLNGLALTYLYGAGNPQNKKLSWQLFRKAAEMEFVPAFDYVGRAYQYGLGVTKDEKSAIQWYTKAAAKDYVHAQFSLGNLYMENRKFLQAKSWYEKAANQNHAGALNNLGTMYHDGKGVIQSNSIAKSWYRMAIVKGNVEARKNLKTIENAEREIAAKKQREKENAAANKRKIDSLEVGDGVYVRGIFSDEIVFVMRINKSNNTIKVRKKNGYTKWIKIADVISEGQSIVNDLGRKAVVYGAKSAVCYAFPDLCEEK